MGFPREEYWSGLPFLSPGYIPTQNYNSKDTQVSLFIEVLFEIDKTWKQPKCPLTDEWIKKIWYIYTMEYYSVITKSEMMPFAATWMEQKMIILSEVSQKEKDKQYDIMYKWNLKYDSD